MSSSTGNPSGEEGAPWGGRGGGPSAGAVLAALLGLGAAWIVAGSTGVLGHPLRRGLTFAALAGAVLIAWPRTGKPHVRLGLLAAASAAAIAMIASMLPPVNVLAVAMVLLALAYGQSETGRKTMLLAAEAVVFLAFYRLACTSIPPVWHAADYIGGVLGRLAGVLCGRPLSVGATFAAIDVLVTMAYLAVMAPLRDGWLRYRVRFPRRQILLALSGVLAGQLVYLAALALAADLPERFWGVQPAGIEASGDATVETAARPLRALVPWHLPALAAIIQVLVGWPIFRRWAALASQADSPPRRRAPRWLCGAAAAAAVLLAAILPPWTTSCWQRPDLGGKKIVLYEKGFLNWLRPRHGDYGRLSIGMYGMLPTYLESLGARSLVSPDLSAEDLRDADGLILLFPNEPWAEDQLERIWQFVRRGGKLLVMGEHTVREDDGGSRINDVLAPTGMRVRFDSATFAVGGWLHSYEALSHPTSAGIPDDQNNFGVVIGASVEAPWPARPLLVGRWGWADPGDQQSGPAMMGNRLYDPGERLGDLVLAAERPLGKGVVVVFGDTSGLTNGLTIGCHEYTSRLLAYLGSDSSGPQPTWRQLAGLLAILAILALSLSRPAPWHLAAVSATLALSLAVCTEVTSRRWTVLPDGNVRSPNNLAYIDSSHAEAFSRESWRPDGVMGLAMTLMRNGYLTLMLPELTDKRLQRARLLVSIAPTREFSGEERRIVREFVRTGGIFICTVGHDRCEASRLLLSELGFHVGRKPGDPHDQEPYPLGHFKAPFFNGGDYYAYVRFHAAWPIHCTDAKALVVSHYPPNQPLIVIRRYGRGLVAVIGDTCFAMNKNLEREDGGAFEGMRENADFWRWFLALLGEGEPWYPPKPSAGPDADVPQPPPDDPNPQEAP